MNSRLGVNKDAVLEEIREKGGAGLPAPVKFLAKIISYIFHPVFIPVYLVYFIVFVHPYLLAGETVQRKREIIGMAFVSFTFFPLVTVLLLKGLNFISSIKLETRQDRIIPLIACAVWYFWIWWVWHNLNFIPHELTLLAISSWITVAVAPFLNVIMKVSLHMIAMGVMLAVMFLMALSSELEFGLFISLSLFLTGLVGTARLIDSDHRPVEIYGGLILGAGTTLVLNFLY